MGIEWRGLEYDAFCIRGLRARDGVAMSDEVLTIKEVAALLKLAEKTVYAMANAGELPAKLPLLYARLTV